MSLIIWFNVVCLQGAGSLFSPGSLFPMSYIAKVLFPTFCVSLIPCFHDPMPSWFQCSVIPWSDVSRTQCSTVLSFPGSSIPLSNITMMFPKSFTFKAIYGSWQTPLSRTEVSINKFILICWFIRLWTKDTISLKTLLMSCSNKSILFPPLFTKPDVSLVIFFQVPRFPRFYVSLVLYF